MCTQYRCTLILPDPLPCSSCELLCELLCPSAFYAFTSVLAAWKRVSWLCVFSFLLWPWRPGTFGTQDSLTDMSATLSGCWSHQADERSRTSHSLSIRPLPARVCRTQNSRPLQHCPSPHLAQPETASIALGFREDAEMGAYNLPRRATLPVPGFISSKQRESLVERALSAWTLLCKMVHICGEGGAQWKPRSMCFGSAPYILLTSGEALLCKSSNVQA